MHRSWTINRVNSSQPCTNSTLGPPRGGRSVGHQTLLARYLSDELPGALAQRGGRRLAGCSAASPCASAACPVCRALGDAWLAGTCRKLLGTKPHGWIAFGGIILDRDPITTLDAYTPSRLHEAERFERANLAARRVWLDYVGMLRALWAASWEPAVRAHFPGAKLLSYAEHSAFSSEVETLADPSVVHAWQQKAVAGVFELGGFGRLFTRVGLTNGEREGELQFYLYGPDQTCAVTDVLDLGPDWGDDGENRRVTRAGLVAFAHESGELDPAHLATLTIGATASLASALV